MTEWEPLTRLVYSGLQRPPTGSGDEVQPEPRDFTTLIMGDGEQTLQPWLLASQKGWE